ncbi:hypothetical protein MKEN_01152800 [Mycena kentingensis (nom. inval.)]|nr:hypothetical protein MKEN_01152800 [Mycena kentingensis (nom. inval.)]
MFSRIQVQLYVALAAAATFTSPKKGSALVCDGGMCLNQVFDPATRSSYAFALPEGGSFDKDYVARLQIPIPYGFAGFSFAKSKHGGDNCHYSRSDYDLEDVVPVTAVFCCKGPGNNPDPQDPDDDSDTRRRAIGNGGTIVDSFTTSNTDPTALRQIPARSGSTITISPTLTTFNESLVTFVFRVQNGSMPDVDTMKPFQMVFFNSDAIPTADDSTGEELDTMPMAGAVVSTFPADDVHQFVSADYERVLSAAGFD